MERCESSGEEVPKINQRIRARGLPEKIEFRRAKRELPDTPRVERINRADADPPLVIGGVARAKGKPAPELFVHALYMRARQSR